MITTKSLTWPNIVHRRIMRQYDEFIVVGRDIYYSNPDNHFVMTVNPDQSIDTRYMIRREEPHNFTVLKAHLEPHDESELKILEISLTTLNNFKQ